MKKAAACLGFVLVSSGVAIGASCGGVSTPDGETPADELALDDYERETAAAICRAAADCGRVEDVAACAAVVSLREIPLAVDAVRAGRLAYDGKAAKSCLEDRIKYGCDYDTPHDAFAACDDVFSPAARAGEACVVDPLVHECVEGACIAPAGGCDASCCMGTCGPLPGIGEGCNVVEGCAPGAYCADQGSFDSPPPKCEPGSRPPTASGGDIGLPCSGPDDCFLSGRCEGGTCLGLPNEGEPCESNCNRDDLACVDGVCKRRPGLGAACGDGQPCLEIAQCNAGICERTPGYGEACSLDCLYPSYCSDAKCANDDPLPACP